MIRSARSSISPSAGLSNKEASKRLFEYGLNEIPSEKNNTVLELIIDIVKEPMILLLLVSSILYGFLGEKQDAVMLLFGVLVVISIELVQERKTGAALEKLKELSNPKALVVREGQQIVIPSRELVPGDIVFIKEGDRVPADGLIRQGLNISVDESLLTGESVPVVKKLSILEKDIGKPGGDNNAYLFSGSLVVGGQGYFEVVHTGLYTEIGKIGKSLESVGDEKSLLEHETEKLVKIFATSGLLLCVGLILIYGLVRHLWLSGLLSGITLSMSMIPEEFPVVLTVFLTLGSWRIAQKKVLVRHKPTIETLGSITVLCVDKTGTLTQNKQEIESVWIKDEAKTYQLKTTNSPNLLNLIKYALFSSQEKPFDPLEKAIHSAFEQVSKESFYKSGMQCVKEYPLTSQFPAVTMVWKEGKEDQQTIAAKGAPEVIASLCDLSPQDQNLIDKEIKRMAEKGLRILAVAGRKQPGGKLPDSPKNLQFTFLGLLGFRDPVRSQVPAAVSECYQAGIRVVMITGDYPKTACVIAHTAGIKHADTYLTGNEVENLSIDELAAKIKTVNVFARVVPEQKLAIVEALKKNGEIVAMTGDGINDAPALKAAHVGISMGKRGTDVAREASDMILFEDDFTSIVSSIRLGRTIYSNLKKAFTYVLSIHFPIAGLALLPTLFNFPAILLPAHIAFLELVIDPACSTVFEGMYRDEAIMQRPPRDTREPLLSLSTILRGAFQGLSVLAVSGIVAIMLYRSGQSDYLVRTVTFAILMMGNLCLIVTNLSWRKSLFSSFQLTNKALVVVVIGALIVLSAIIFIPALSELFHFGQLGLFEVLGVLLTGIALLIWLEGAKMTAAKDYSF